MNLSCLISCALTPFNITLGGLTLIACVGAFLAYKFSRSYRVRVTSLYIAIGLIPLTMTFVSGNFNCSSWTTCIPHIMGLIFKGLLASTFVVGIVYYLWGSQIFVKAIGGKHMKREDFPGIHRLLDDVCLELKIKTPALYFIESGKPKALSFSGSKNAIVLSVGVVELLSKKELKAVLAHEVAHLKNKHPMIKFISRYLGFSYVYGFCLSKDLEREQEMYANEVAERLVGRKTLLGAIDKFND